MKKSLIALAALGAFAGAASAQSSVTIYGIIDVGVSRIDDGTTGLGNPALFGGRDRVDVRSSTSSRLGFRGTEDLGGGLKANFTLEHRLDPSSGAQENLATGFWHAQSWVGLSGGFGEVRLGRQYVPAFYVALASDPWGYDYNVAGGVNFTRGGNGVTRANNAVTYRTPNLSGFTAEVQVAAGEGGAAAVGAPVAGRNAGFNIQYAGGPLWVGLGYNDAQQVNTGTDNKYFVVGAAYDLGFVRPIVSYSQGNNNQAGNPDRKTYLVGATAPLAGGRLKAIVARDTRFISPLGFGSTTGAGVDATKFGLGYEYFLSKRTSVHADVGTAKADGLTRSTGVEAGVKHVF
jgi:predicted porin